MFELQLFALMCENTLFVFCLFCTNGVTNHATLMCPAISMNLKKHIVCWYHNEQMTMEEIAELASVSVGLVSKFINLHRHYNQVTDPYTLWNACPSYFNLGDKKYLGTIIEANPSLYLDEIQERIATNCNLHVSIATICRTLHHVELNHKRISKTTSQTR
jgi:transposase